MQEELLVQYRKGNDTDQDEFIDLINYVFNMNGKDNDFYRLLPKLYKKEYHPCGYNYLALEDGRIKAAVGSFPGTINVCGMTLNYQGIGNVAVHPYSRSKGYMKELMNQAVAGMLSEDVDFSVLSGKRNRYAYFSYEIVGRKSSFWLDESNIQHVLGKEHKVKFQFLPVKETDIEILEEILKLQQTQPFYYEREAEKHYDILKTWTDVAIYGIYEEQSFSGYLLCYGNNTIKEIILKQADDITDVIADFIITHAKSGLTVEIPDYQRKFADALSVISEQVTVKDDDNFSVFHYDKVIKAFLTLKAQYDQLADGEICLLIHGKKRDEKLFISVKDNLVSVIPTEQKADYEFHHLEAMSVLFGNYSALRNPLPTAIKTWLPLPLYIFPADAV
ncbi:MAG: acetyltransferase, family [Herbinix sp.]|jgi:predicted acetyltransferase|nr:acetyltransferase, family [Herbinix sp.]